MGVYGGQVALVPVPVALVPDPGVLVPDPGVPVPDTGSQYQISVPVPD